MTPIALSVACIPHTESNTPICRASKRNVGAVPASPLHCKLEWSLMNAILSKRIAVVAIVAASSFSAWAGSNVKIAIPGRSRLSIVQRLNREGVEAVKKNNFEQAETLFLKAYLYDPADPFTLNNLGYISELTGRLERAHRFYQLAAEQGCNANIDLSSAKSLQGKPMKAAFESIQDLPMRINRMNVEAMRLLSENQNAEAAALLNQALALDPRNPFTLNNLGVVAEAQGDYQAALKYYRAAAAAPSSQHVILALDRSWSGKPVSELAAAGVKRMERRESEFGSGSAQAVLLSTKGVIEENQNNWTAARQDFLRAYSLDPSGAFALNNRGYVAEMDGDLESAQYFYEKARKASGAGARVGLATEPSAAGKPLFSVASVSDQKVDGALTQYSQQRRMQSGPIELTPRSAAPAQDRPSSNPSTSQPPN